VLINSLRGCVSPVESLQQSPVRSGSGGNNNATQMDSASVASRPTGSAPPHKHLRASHMPPSTPTVAPRVPKGPPGLRGAQLSARTPARRARWVRRAGAICSSRRTGLVAVSGALSQFCSGCLLWSSSTGVLPSGRGRDMRADRRLPSSRRSGSATLRVGREGAHAKASSRAAVGQREINGHDWQCC
jgi:hypothetical protein